MGGGGGAMVEAPNAQCELVDACKTEIEKRKYKILGRGEFGEVLQINVEMGEKKEKRNVAVKVLNEKNRTNKVAINDFKAEIKNHQKFHHPNILELYDAKNSDNDFMMVLEIGSTNLEEVLQRQIMLPLWRRFEIALDVARGLEYLHNLPQPIIHRDLKPANILLVNAKNDYSCGSLPVLPRESPAMKEDIVKYFGCAKICDFGLASFTKEHRERLKKLTGKTGSFRYMAPEVYGDEQYDTRVDIYSFTMIFYFMLSGQPPFGDKIGIEAAETASERERPPSLRWKQFVRDAMGKSSADEKKKVIQQIENVFSFGWSTNTDRRMCASELIAQLEGLVRAIPRPAVAKVAEKKALQKWTRASDKIDPKSFERSSSFGRSFFNMFSRSNSVPRSQNKMRESSGYDTASV